MKLETQPIWALKNMIRALSMHSWFNTEEENERLRNAKCELKRRKKRRIKKNA